MRDFRVRGFFAFVVLACVVSLPSCSGKPAITITLTPQGSSACGTTTNSACAVTLQLPAQPTESITASVANDSTNAGVNWSIGSSVGSLSNQTTTSVTYVAPTALSANTTATVTATSVANTAVTASVTITIDTQFEFETGSLPVATQDVAYTATISTIGATGPFTWSILSGNLPAGLTLSNGTSAADTITGTPTTVGTSTVTVQATDAAGTPISRTFTITVNPPPALTITTPATITSGTVGQSYSFTLQAEFGTPPYTWSLVSGNLPAGLNPLSSSGVISGTPTTPGTSTFIVQVQDSASPNPAIAKKQLTLTINLVSVNQELTGNYAFLVSGFDPSGGRFIAAGSFTATSCNITNGTIDTNDAGTLQSLTNLSGNCSIDATGVGTLTFAERTFALSFVPTGSGNSIPNADLIEFDDTDDQVSGVLLQQTVPSATPSGNYAFGLLGADAASHRYALAGSFATGTTSGVLDSDDAGTPQANVPFTLSALNAPNPSTGRGTLAFTVGGTASNYAYYVVNPTQALVMEIDQNATVAGAMLAQSGSLGASSLTDAVFETSASSAGAALTQLGVVTTDGMSTLNTSFDKSTGGITQSSSGTYAVTPATGRTTLTQSGLAMPDPVVYLAQANEGFFVGSDAAVTFGFMKAQTPGSTLSGIYAGGSIPPVLSGPSGQVEAASASGGVLNLTYDASTSGGLLENQSTNTGYTAAVSNGRGTITSMPPTNSLAIYYIVSQTEFWTLTPANGVIQIFQASGALGVFQQ